MTGALQKVAKHDFPFPQGEVVKLAGCSGAPEYYLTGTQPVSNCGYRAVQAAPEPPAVSPTTTPMETAVPTAASSDTPPPENSVGDGTKFVPLNDTPAPKPTATPKKTP